MYKRGGFGPKNMCPYCGGPHHPGQCPMMMMPPAMPTPSIPMGGMMPGMGEMMPPGGQMHDMEQMMHEMHMQMMKMDQTLNYIKNRVDEIYKMLLAMQTGMAKG